MRRSIARAAAAIMAGAVFGALALTGISTASAAPRAVPRPGARLWLTRYNGPASADDVATALAVSPDGRTVYVTGHSTGTASSLQYATVAYNAATGARRWAARYSGPGSTANSATALAVSPDGRTLYVTGTSSGQYATVAYRAATGARLWVARHHGPVSGGTSSAVAVTVSPDSGTVFVTGTTQYGDDPSCADSAYDTVAYSAATGTQRWSAQLCDFSSALALAVSPDGKRVYVTGQWDAECGACMLYGTVAYNAATGATAWTRYYGVSGAQAGNGSAIAVSPDSARVYVTGSITRTSGGSDYGTIAYSASGQRLWVRRYRTPGPFSNLNLARSLAVSPAGTVVVTGYRPGSGASSDYATVAYSPAGRQLWVRLYSATGKGSDVANSVATSGNGKVYVTGASQGAKSGLDYATIAYNIHTGAQLWVRRYNGPANGADQATSLAARAGRVFVTGSSQGAKSGLDYATIAYQG